MSDLEPEAKAKRRIDTFVYGAVALGMVGINVKDYFEAQSEISIMKAEADAKIYVIKAQMELEIEKRKLEPELQARLELLESQVRELILENQVLKENSHAPGGR